MCCSVTPDVKVHFSNTILYGAEAVNLQGETVHVLGYQNRVQNNVNGGFTDFQLRDVFSRLKRSFNKINSKSSDSSQTGNAMILPFPAVPQTMSQKNIIDTEKVPNILKDLAEAVNPPTQKIAYYSIQSLEAQPKVQIFEAAGIYTVILAQDALAIPEVMDQVPKEKRPKLNLKLFEAYAKWYPDWTIALCCFNNEKLEEALPMLWWYKPMFPEKIFLPMLDSHTGSVPKLKRKVVVDHTVVVGSSFADSLQSVTSEKSCLDCGKPNPQENTNCSFCGSYFIVSYEINFQRNYGDVYYRDRSNFGSNIEPYLLSKVIGQTYKTNLPNGDFICEIDDVRKGIWQPDRVIPPGAV